MSAIKKLEDKWQNLLNKNGSTDIEVSPSNINVLKNWCISKKYVYKFILQHEDKFIYAVAKTKELLMKHEEER